jgi:phage terminase large subunit
MAKKISGLPPEIIRNIVVEDVINKAYIPYLNGIWHYEVYYGGAGSGKSFFAAGQKIAMQMSAIPGRNMLALRNSANDARDSVYPELLGALRQFHLLDVWNIVEHPKIRLTNLANGNEIIFDGLDDVENIKSIKFKNGNLTDVLLEEATEIKDPGTIRQLDLRLRDMNQKGRIIILFNPVSAQHFLKNMIEKEFIPSGDCIVCHTTYKDNKFLPKSYAQSLEALRFTDPYRYMVYALGQWGVMGASVFNANIIHKRLQDLAQIREKVQPIRGNFSYSRDDNGHILVSSFEFYKNEDGETKIYVEPIPRHPYVMSLDTAGEGSDYHACHVIDNLSGEQVAVFHSQDNPDRCVYQAFGLATYYNNALFVPEVNFDSYHLNKFKELGYINIYQRGTPSDSYSDGYVQKLGFRTTVENRQRMLSECVEFVNANANLINDEETLNECLTFTRQEKKMKGIFWGAEPGTHDDLVMAFAIVLQARQQAPSYMVAEQIGKLTGEWTEQELKDAVVGGRVSNIQAIEYRRTHTHKNITTIGGDKKKKVVGRYGR